MFPVSESNAKLWAAVRMDDEMAFTALFDRYWVRLYNACIRHVKDPELSEEIVHDIFLNIWSRRKELDIVLFEHFLLRAVRYQVYNRMRLAKLPVAYQAETFYEEYTGYENEGSAKIKEQELEREVINYLQQLPKRCREIFQMSRFKNLSNQEIATELGISKRSVENQISVAVKHLKVCLKHVFSVLLF